MMRPSQAAGAPDRSCSVAAVLCLAVPQTNASKLSARQAPAQQWIQESKPILLSGSLGGWRLSLRRLAVRACFGRAVRVRGHDLREPHESAVLWRPDDQDHSWGIRAQVSSLEH